MNLEEALAFWDKPPYNRQDGIKEIMEAARLVVGHHQHKSEEGFDLTLICDVTHPHEVLVVVQTTHTEGEIEVLAESVTQMGPSTEEK